VTSQKYRIVLADIPWEYANRFDTRKDNPYKKNRFGVGVASRYSKGVEKDEYLKLLGEKIKAVSAEDAYLFFWATCPRLNDAFSIIESWGFEYVTVAFNWIKINKNSGTPFSGPGFYSFSNCEPVLLAKKKNKPCWNKNDKGCYKPNQIIMEPHPRDENGKIIHSRKPETLHLELEKWLGPYIGEGKMLELFATQKREGWTCLGHAISGKTIDVELDEIIASTFDPQGGHENNVSGILN